MSTEDQNQEPQHLRDQDNRSPLLVKGALDHRISNTEYKIPFKNCTNDWNIPFQTEQKQGGNKIKQDQQNPSFVKDKTRDNKKQQQRENKNKQFQGDRFIPCRQNGLNYEVQFHHEDSQANNCANGGSNANSSLDIQVDFDSQANIQTTNGTQQTQGSQINSAGDQNQQIYANLLQTQCLGDSLFSPQGSFENLSYMDLAQSCEMGIGNPSPPVGILNGVQNGFSSQSNPQSVKTKKNIFKYQNNSFRRTQLSENAAYSISPLLNIDTDEYASSNNKVTRKIPKMPFKVLDAPQLQDDFYLNLVDWSSSNILAVGLGKAVYIWSACTSRVTKLCEVPMDDSITSVGWSQRGTHLAVGTNSGDTQIWDTNHCKLVRTLTGHLSRVGTVAWNGSIVSTGSRDRNILQRDLRDPNQVVSKLCGHKQEVCGLKWSFDETQLASGGNDNKLMVWGLHSEQPLVKFSDHTAAVKAIGWSPHQNGLLASGGGTADRCIRFWNTHTLQPINFIDTGSQVCNLMFSKNVNEIVSTHGYSLNQIIMWKYPTMQKVATLTGHTYRVLYLSMSPDGQNIVTGAGDETLRFWSVFPSIKGKSDSIPFGGTSSLFPSSMDIR